MLVFLCLFRVGVVLFVSCLLIRLLVILGWLFMMEVRIGIVGGVILIMIVYGVEIVLVLFVGLVVLIVRLWFFFDKLWGIGKV